MPWGQVVRLRYAGQDYPAGVGPGALGAFRVGWFGAPGKDGRIAVTGGDTFVAAIEFGEKVRAQGILVTGNSTEAWTGHFGDHFL